jgi:hypothetical protein
LRLLLLLLLTHLLQQFLRIVRLHLPAGPRRIWPAG